jgi:hypothetical protein
MDRIAAQLTSGGHYNLKGEPSDLFVGMGTKLWV